MTLLLVTGPAGAGKTTTATEWAATHPETAAHVSHDSVTMFVRSGFVSGADAHRDPEGERQWKVGIDVCAAAARIYADASIHCVIDTFLVPASLPLWASVADLQPRVVVLLPDVERAVTRNAGRVNWGVSEAAVRANHAAMQAWRGWRDGPAVMVLDTSRMELAEVVREIRAWTR